MSEDNQNSQTPSSPESQANQPETTAGQTTKPLQKQYQKVQPSWKTKVTQLLQQLHPWWNTALAKIRSLLPNSLSAKLSDTLLTGVLAAIFLLIVWTTSSIFSHRSPQVVNIPQEIFVTNTTPVELIPPKSEPSQEITQLPEQQPTPPILTPEQTLIASIENQVAEVSDRVGSGLIQSIQANFLSSSLIIRISDNWYTLDPSQQQELAAKIQQSSKEFEFTHVDIIDAQGKLVARNPVVGTEMIIFRRQL